MSLSSPLFGLLMMVPIVASLLLGAQLRVEHVRDVVQRPRALLVGLGGQYLLLPLLATLLFYAYPAPEHVRWGWFILAAVPGGVFSNMVTFVGRGRLSLSVVLTACSTVTGVVTIPLWVRVGAGLLSRGVPHELPVAKMMMGSFLFLTVPLAIGLAVGILRPTLAEQLRRPTRSAMFVLLVISAVAYLGQRWRFIAHDFDIVTLAGAAIFHALAVLGGWWLARGFGLDRRDGFTIGIEVGIQNIVIALLIVELLGRPDLVPFVGYYSLVTLVLLIVWVATLAQPASQTSRSHLRSQAAGSVDCC